MILLIILLLNKNFKCGQFNIDWNSWDCISCSNSWSARLYNCLICNQQYNSKPKECMDICDKSDYPGFYRDDNNLYRKCYESCKVCYGQGNRRYHNCKECANDYYKLEENYCFSNKTIKNLISNYYLYNDKDNLVWRKCYKDCETCPMPGNEKSMNCLSCNNNNWWEWTKPKLILLSNDNCMKECDNNK